MNAFLLPLGGLSLYYVISRVSWIAYACGQLLFLLQVLSYLGVFILNPGVPNMKRFMCDEASLGRIKDSQ